jgi:hypothetical protein
MNSSTQLSNTEAYMLGLAAEYRFGLNQHRKAIKVLALELLNRRPDAFPSLAEDPELLSDFMEIHDQAKLHPKYFWGMVKFFGVNIRELPEEQKKSAQALIFEMNGVDQENARMFFESYGLIDSDGFLSSKALQLLQIERIVDAVERGSSQFSAEEFGREMAKGSEFLADAFDVELALSLEANSSIVA